jgi:hypothetical protein
MRVYRGSYVSMAAILLLSATLLAPFMALGIAALLGMFIQNEPVVVGTGVLVYLAVLGLIVAYYVRLRVWLSPDQIVKRSLFGTTTIPLNGNVRFKSFTEGVRAPFLGGAGVVIESVAGDDGSTRYYLTIENEGKTIKLGSTLKGVHEVAHILREIELSHVLPRLCAALFVGAEVDSGALSQSNTQIRIGKRTIAKPLTRLPVVLGKFLYIQFMESKPRQVRVRMKDLWNPHATKALLAGGVPGAE